MRGRSAFETGQREAQSRQEARFARRSGERGSAILIILILLVLMTALVVSNCLALHFLKRELKLVERKQKQQSSQVVRGPEVPQPNSALPPEATTEPKADK